MSGEESSLGSVEGKEREREKKREIHRERLGGWGRYYVQDRERKRQGEGREAN